MEVEKRGRESRPDCQAVPASGRVAVFRALHLGDMLCAVPALRSLRAAWPHAEITLIGLPWAETFVSRFSAYLDHFLEFPGFPGIPERSPDRNRMAAFLRYCDSQRFDLAIQLHGNGSVSNAFVRRIGARLTAGFFPPEGVCPDPRRFIPYPDHGSEIARLLQLTRFLGAPDQGQTLLFPLTSYDEREADDIVAKSDLAEGHFAVVHPGSRDPERRWPARHFADVARFLHDNRLKVALTGTDQERPLIESVIGEVGGPLVNLAGETTLGGLAALLKRSRVVLCNDTGVSHLAAAVRAPSVVVFTGSDPRRWAPSDPMLHRTVGDPFGVKPRQPSLEEVRREVARFASRENAERIRVRQGQPSGVAPVKWRDIKRLLLFATGGIEDLEQVVPAVQALRRRLPRCRIVLLAFSSDEATRTYEEEFRLSSGIDDFWRASAEDGLSWSTDSVTPALEKQIQERGFDAVVVFTRAGQTPYPAAYRCYLAGVPVRVGASAEFGGGLLTHWIRDLADHLPPVDRNLRMLEAVGLQLGPSEVIRQEPLEREAR